MSVENTEMTILDKKELFFNDIYSKFNAEQKSRYKSIYNKFWSVYVKVWKLKKSIKELEGREVKIQNDVKKFRIKFFIISAVFLSIVWFTNQSNIDFYFITLAAGIYYLWLMLRIDADVKEINFKIFISYQNIDILESLNANLDLIMLPSADSYMEIYERYYSERNYVPDRLNQLTSYELDIFKEFKIELDLAIAKEMGYEVPSFYFL